MKQPRHFWGKGLGIGCLRFFGARESILALWAVFFLGKKLDKKKAKITPQLGIEPKTYRLTAWRSTY
jgi:hypothetical protein